MLNLDSLAKGLSGLYEQHPELLDVSCNLICKNCAFSFKAHSSHETCHRCPDLSGNCWQIKRIQK